MARTPEAPASQGRTYRPQSAAHAFARILHRTDPWIAVGDFVDDWRRSAPEARLALVEDPIATVGKRQEFQRWAAFFAAMVEALCQEAGLPTPAWTARPDYLLPEPWYLYPGDHPQLRAWQEATTPEPFKRRNILGGDQILARV
jgi:hypothetical protein